MGRGREQQGRLLEAFEAYERFGTLNGNKELVSDVVEPNTRSRPDVWSRGRIQAMLAKATPQQRKELDDEIARRWQKRRDAKDLDELRQFVAVFGSQFGTGKEARLQLVERLLAAGGPELLTEAEKNLLELSSAAQRREDPAHAARAVEALVRLSVRRGLYEDAVRYYKSGKSFTYRHLPFWLASLVDRMVLVLVPLAVVLIPGMKVVPWLYKWRINARIYRRYGELMALERIAFGETTREERADLLKRLDDIDRRIVTGKLPASAAEQLYVLRQHIHFVRNRILQDAAVART